MKDLAEIKSELSPKEFKDFESLVFLGDSVELAYKTVLKQRENPPNLDFYRFAYEN